MDQDAIVKQMKALKTKAKAARKDGQQLMAKTFKSGADRLSRKIRVAQAIAKKAIAKAT